MDETTPVEAPKMPEQPKAAERPRMRQIIIETDGNDIRIVKSEAAGKIELMTIFQVLADSIRVAKE